MLQEEVKQVDKMLLLPTCPGHYPEEGKLDDTLSPSELIEKNESLDSCEVRRLGEENGLSRMAGEFEAGPRCVFKWRKFY